MAATTAEALKEEGNKHFKSGAFESAVEAYTRAIIKNPEIVAYYTNRALCSLRLARYHDVLRDCDKARELDSAFYKGFYYRGQALEQLNRLPEAAKALHRAFELARAAKAPAATQVKAARNRVKKALWTQQLAAREQQRSATFSHLQQLLDADRKRKLSHLGVGPDSDNRGADAAGDNETEQLQTQVDRIEREHADLSAQLQEMFLKASEASERRSSVPEHLCCKISFEVMSDPVITPSGVTFDRASLQEHFAAVGHFDPMSREPLTESQLIANRAIKEAIDDFVAENPWVDFDSEQMY